MDRHYRRAIESGGPHGRRLMRRGRPWEVDGYPGISVFDLEAAWQYAETHREEIEQAIRLHRVAQGAHAGIIVCTRDDADPSAFAQRIHSSLVSCGNPTGQLIRIVRPSRN